MTIINWRLISHPMNWVIILLMLIIAGIFGHLLLTILEQEPATASTRGVPNGYSASPTGDNSNPIEPSY